MSFRVGSKIEKKENQTWMVTYSDLLTTLLVFMVLLVSSSDFKKGKLEKVLAMLSTSESVPTISLATIEKTLETYIVSEGLQQSVSLSLEDDGLKVSLDSGAMFDTGKAIILPSAQPKMEKLLGALVKYQTKYKFAVEGHADSRPVQGGEFKSNWELSSARAMQVRTLIEGLGIQSSAIRVEAYGDTQSLPPEKLTGLTQEEILSKHRRVVIRVY